MSATEVNAFATCPKLWGWMALVGVLLKSSIQGIAISLVLAYIVLIVACTNIIVATMAIGIYIYTRVDSRTQKTIIYMRHHMRHHIIYET